MVSHWLSGGCFSLAGLLVGKEKIILPLLSSKVTAFLPRNVK